MPKPDNLPVRNVVEKIDNTNLVEQFRLNGGRLFHALPRGKRRGVTFAYVVKKSRIEISTGVQHRNDPFTKKVGTKNAIEHFNTGRTIHLPLSSEIHIPRLLTLLVAQSQ